MKEGPKTPFQKGISPEAEPDSSCLYAVKPIPVLAARLSDEPWPKWLRKLWNQGRLWRDGRGYHAGCGESRVDLSDGDYVILDAADEIRTCHPVAFENLFEPYAPRKVQVDLDDVILGVAYREDERRRATGSVRGWGDLRWELAVNEAGYGRMRVFGRDVVDSLKPVEFWSMAVHIPSGLVRDVMEKDGPKGRDQMEVELARVVARILSNVDVSVLSRELLIDFESQEPLPHGHGRRQR